MCNEELKQQLEDVKDRLNKMYVTDLSEGIFISEYSGISKIEVQTTEWVKSLKSIEAVIDILRWLPEVGDKK